MATDAGGLAPEGGYRAFAPAGIPLARPGDDLVALLRDGLECSGESLEDGDVVVVAQKIFSKAEGRYARLADVVPGTEAAELARKTEKDPRLVELILRESSEVLRHRPGLIVVCHRLGYVLANAGIDASNVEDASAPGAETVLLLPEDPDVSSERLRAGLRAAMGVNVAVIMNDSLGRAWRMGTIGTALGAAGLTSLLDLRGEPDLFGTPLRVTQVALADELAAAASLLMGQGREGRPVVVIRGLRMSGEDSGARELVRPAAQDMFR